MPDTPATLQQEPRLPVELLISIVHTVLADSIHTIFSVGNPLELEWQLNVIATLSLTNSTFHQIVTDSVKELMDLKQSPVQGFQSREFLGDVLALGRQQRDPGAPSMADRSNRRFLSTLLKGYQQFVLIIALRTMFHRLGKAKTDIIPLNHLVDRVTAKMLSQLEKIRPAAIAGPLRRMAETERQLSRILSRATSASEMIPDLVASYTAAPSLSCMHQLLHAMHELEECTADHVAAMKNYQYAATVVPFFRVLGVPEDAQSLDNLAAALVRDDPLAVAAEPYPATPNDPMTTPDDPMTTPNNPHLSTMNGPHLSITSDPPPIATNTSLFGAPGGPFSIETTELLARYARLKREWDVIDPGTAIVCLPLPVG